MSLIKTIISNSFLWRKIRYKRIVAKHKEVADFWNPIIDEYCKGSIEKYSFTPKVKFDDQKIVWQYWGQGINESTPEIVKICFDSIDKYCADYKIIRLTDNNISDYLDLPEFVYEKLANNKAFTRTFFSDLLRLCLLTTYGGVWLDATILLTGKLPLEYTRYDFFMFQRDEKAEHKDFWEKSYAYYWGWGESFRVNMLSSVLFAKKGSIVINSLTNLMLYYWKNETKLNDYFCFQILFNELVKGKLRDKNCTIISDTIPHIFQAKINSEYNWINEDEMFRVTTIHKMSYFDNKGIEKLKLLLKNR
jgi:Capsular polysaccharide synthesis protein.